MTNERCLVISNLNRVERLSTLDRTTGCRIWNGAITASGAPRLAVDDSQVDARRLVYEAVHDCELPARTRMRSTCGNKLCVRSSHVSVVGDGMLAEDFVSLECPTCGNTAAVNKTATSLRSFGYCGGSGRLSHRLCPG